MLRFSSNLYQRSSLINPNHEHSIKLVENITKRVLIAAYHVGEDKIIMKRLENHFNNKTFKN